MRIEMFILCKSIFFVNFYFAGVYWTRDKSKAYVYNDYNKAKADLVPTAWILELEKQ